VGRRIWRRRKRRSSPSSTTPSTTPSRDDEQPVEEPEPEPPPHEPAPPPKKRGGLFGALFGSKPKPPPQDPPYLVVDPTRDVLAVPRGAARLDAFEKALVTTPPGTPQFKALALAFHKELQALAEGAGVDLSLLETRVDACAKALIAAGEEERAGTLFLRVGRRHQAAELFVAAGAIDALEEAHAQIHWDEGGAKLDARMSFERFEALFVVGLRDQAFEALERAHRLWHDNPVYAEIHASFLERLGAKHRLRLTSGAGELVVVGAWPVVIGRGEEAGVRLTSPLISRAHLRLDLVAGASGKEIVVVDLESRGGTRIGGAPLAGKQRLVPGQAIDMAGVVVETATADGALLLTPALAPERKTLAATATEVKVGDVAVRFDGRGRAVLQPPAVLNGEALKRPTLLLEGDKLGSWTVAKRT
jgi:tetratricopeptide (TPR) repeat protein